MQTDKQRYPRLGTARVSTLNLKQELLTLLLMFLDYR